MFFNVINFLQSIYLKIHFIPLQKLSHNLFRTAKYLNKYTYPVYYYVFCSVHKFYLSNLIQPKALCLPLALKTNDINQ